MNLLDLTASFLRKHWKFLFEGRGLGGGETGADTPTALSLEEWVERRKSAFAPRVELQREIDNRLVRLTPEAFGLSGPIFDELTRQFPRMLPIQFWGGDLGWRSQIRKRRWLRLLSYRGLQPLATDIGYLIRFQINPTDWIPHPYAPISGVTYDYDVFAKYVCQSRDVYQLCVRWRAENTAELQRRLEERLRPFHVKLSASFQRVASTDRAEVAILVPSEEKDLLCAKTVWKHETALARLVKDHFPDACREYSPNWLGGQRLDVYIPSLQVAFEYQGEQHYAPVAHFGGEAKFSVTLERDRRKAEACKRAGITLVEWKHSDAISLANLVRKLTACGVDWQPK